MVDTISKQRAKGTLAETALLRLLEDNGIMVVRNPLAGTHDKGDLTIFGNKKIILEVKNHRTMDLATWIDEAAVEKANAKADLGVVAHKRLRKGDPKDWYISMPVSEFLTILNLITP